MNQNIENTIKNPADVLKINSQSESVPGKFTLLYRKYVRGWFIEVNYLFPYLFAYFVQGIFYPVFYVFYNTFFDLKINGKDNILNLNQPIIFISNHIGSYDSFIFDLFVPPFSKIAPFRFMGTTDVDLWYLKILKYTGVLYFIYLVFGVIRVTYGRGAEVSTQPAAEIINKGGTVAIFPEGKIWVEKNNTEPIGPFKWGAAILARNTGALVIPVAFRREKGNVFFRKKIVVNIGSAYKINFNDRPEIVAEDMRERVIKLWK